MINDDEYMYVNDVYNGYINYENKKIKIIEHESRGGMFKLCEKTNLSKFLDFDLYKILLAGDPNYLEGHYEKIEAQFKDRFNAMFTAPFYYEFTSKNSDKGWL